MRIRPFFWIVLGIVCTAVLVFATIVTNTRAHPLSVQVEQVFIDPDGSALLHFHVMDTDDQLVDQVTILLRASMPAMSMEAPVTALQALGQGGYLARFSLSMRGLWHLVVQASAPGFLPAHQLIMLQVSE